MERRMSSHAQHKTCLAHAGPSGDHYKIGGLKPCRDIVEIVEPGWNTRHMFFSLRELIDQIEAFLDNGIDRSEATDPAFLARC